MKLIGPFNEIVTLQQLPLKGALPDTGLQLLRNAYVLVENGIIKKLGSWELVKKEPFKELEELTTPAVLLPAFVDCHTHICFGGTRNADYAMRIAGTSYLEIARAGGGIWSSVLQTRAATPQELLHSLKQRIDRHVSEGVGVIEIKSGYGLNIETELTMLKTIQQMSTQTSAILIPTCLAAHTLPNDFSGTKKQYLEFLVQDLLPQVKAAHLSNRVDIFIEESAFNPTDGSGYLAQAKKMGFNCTVHADQFTTGGAAIAVEMGACSADHLETSDRTAIQLLAASETVAVSLPGASLGLGMGYAPARKLLDAGACLAISTDWNPGSAPMGDLLMQASVMAAAEKLSTAETLAGITFRAAHALRLSNIGRLAPGYRALFQAYPCADHRDILYYQGKMKPFQVWLS